jgi:hypothetical protein
MGQSTGHKVSLIVCGYCNQDIGILRTGILENRQRSRVATNGAQIKTLLESDKVLGAGIDDSDVIALQNQLLCKACAYPASAQNQNLHRGLNKSALIDAELL